VRRDLGFGFLMICGVVTIVFLVLSFWEMLG
jgi:hypothetical protein